MSNETLKAFYYGNLRPCDRATVPGSEVDKAAAEMSDAENLLSREIPPDLRSVLERFIKAQVKLDGIMAEESYMDGFKTGARFIMEILDDSRENLRPITE